jgi:hypothetical protein
MPAKTAVPSDAAHLGAGALGDHQRHHAEDESERGHQDRPQTQAARLDGRLVARLSLAVQLLGELDDEDRVFARQADQHHQANLHEDIDGLVREQHADDRAEQTQRHDQDDRQRQRPAFVQRRQRQKHESPRPARKHTWPCRRRGAA